MVQRATVMMEKALIVTRVVAAAQTIERGHLLRAGATAGEVVKCGAGERGIYVALENNSTAGSRIQVAFLSPSSILPVIVGTGGASEGAMLVLAADGVTDAPTLGGGTVVRNVVGVAVETGVADDLIGMWPMPFTSVSA